MRVRSRRVDALERAPPYALAGPASPGSGPNHALYSQLKGRDLKFGQAPPWLHVQAVPQGASARPQSKGRCVGAGAPRRSRWSGIARRRAQPCSILSAEGQDLFFGQAPPWLHVQAVPQGASARPQSKGRCVGAGAPRRSRWSGIARQRVQPCSILSSEGQGPLNSGQASTLAARASGASRCECASAVEG